ncbi:MAG: hypothetical protein KC550_00980 [Nanoarchaeota archaeon]|nr:hypothetical protein [Nanoarchaeota archaeon]
MKKITFFTVILGFVFLLSGCASLVDPSSLIKSNYQVKAFLEQYPNAEIKLTHYTYNESYQIASEFKDNCQKELNPKEMYRFYVEDEETEFKLIGYLDLATQNVECIKKYSNEGENNNDSDNNFDDGKNKDEIKPIPSKPEPQKDEIPKDTHEPVRIKLETYQDGDYIKLIWHTDLKNVKYFKVMRSYDNANPKYPEQNAIQVIEPKEDHEKFDTKVKIEKDFAYYRISAVMEDEKIYHSNVFVFKNKYEEHDDKYEDEDKYEKELDYKDYDLELELELEDGWIELKWEVETINNIKYFKVVRSTENSNPKYPEDGYIAVINPEYDEDKYIFKDKENLEKKAYYRITLVTKDNKYIHSNVEKFIPEEIYNDDDKNTHNSDSDSNEITELELKEHCESNDGWWETIEQQCNEINQDACELKDGKYAEYTSCDTTEFCQENPNEADCPVIGCVDTTHSYCNYGHLI